MEADSGGGDGGGVGAPSAASSPWLGRTELSFVQRQAARCLVAGAVPPHVAFIMDGNRRWARRNGCHSVLDGHHSGFDQLTKILRWCGELGISEVSAYAFSLENFKRHRHEVDGLMRLAERKFDELLRPDSLRALREHGVRIRIVGDLGRLPPAVARLVARAQLETERNERCTLNICLAYTGQDEIVRGVRRALRAVQDGHLDVDGIDERSVSHCMDMCASARPALLVRTSGERRLSDFLLWHVTTDRTVVHFTDALWPDFGFWHLAKAILHYQWAEGRKRAVGIVDVSEVCDDEGGGAASSLCAKLRHERRRQLADIASL